MCLPALGLVHVTADDRRTLKGLLTGLKVNKEALVRLYQELHLARTSKVAEKEAADFGEAIAMLKEVWTDRA